MTRFIIILFACVLGTALTAQTFPAFYDVTGVDTNDTLNIRAEPSGSAPILGTLAHDAANLEVTAISENGRWAQLNAGEQSGWVARRYLSFQQDYPFLPMAHLRCFGTEPFWSLHKPQIGQITLDRLDQDEQHWTQRQSQRSTNRTDRFSVIGGRGDDMMVMTLSRAACSDGMSDRNFGISLEVMTLSSQGIHLSGCCSIQAN